jgi:hypothetical protein
MLGTPLIRDLSGVDSEKKLIVENLVTVSLLKNWKIINQ